MEHFLTGFEKKAEGEFHRAMRILNKMRNIDTDPSVSRLERGLRLPKKKTLEVLKGKDFKKSVHLKRSFRKAYPKIWRQIQHTM